MSRSASVRDDDDSERFDEPGQQTTVDFLYSMDAKYKQYVEKLREEYTAREMEEVTGKPIITPYAQSLRRREDFSQRMEKDLVQRRSKADETKQRFVTLHQENEEAECTGRPDLTLTQQYNETHFRHRESIADSIEKFKAEHAVHMENLKQDALKRELMEVQPGPRIVPHQGGNEERRRGLSIEDHLLLAERQRQRKMYEKVEQESNTARKHAHPRITSRAHSVSQSRSESMMDTTVRSHQSVGDRLYAAHAKAPAYDEAYVEHCTFTPRTNHKIGGKEYVDPLADLPLPDRLTQRGLQSHPHTARHRERGDDEVSVQRAEAKPKISENSRAIVERKREYERSNGEFDASPSSRLFRQATRKQNEELLKSRQGNGGAPLPEDFTGHPQLSEKSRRLDQKQSATILARARSGSVQSDTPRRNVIQRQAMWAARKTQKERRVQELKEEKEKEELEACTFRPDLEHVRLSTRKESLKHKKLALSPPRVTNHQGDVATRCLEWGKAVQKKHESQAKEKQSLENPEDPQAVDPSCTFTPMIHHEVPTVAVPHVSTGYDSHLDRMKKAREMRQPPPPKRTPRCTVPKEFKFASSQRTPNRIAALKPPVQRNDLGRSPTHELQYEDESYNELQVALPQHMQQQHQQADFYGSHTPSLRAAEAAQNLLRGKESHHHHHHHQAAPRQQAERYEMQPQPYFTQQYADHQLATDGRGAFSAYPHQQQAHIAGVHAAPYFPDGGAPADEYPNGSSALDAAVDAILHNHSRNVAGQTPRGATNRRR